MAAAWLSGCDYVDTPYTNVVLANDYPASSTPTPIVYAAHWGDVTFSQQDATLSPLAPGESTPPTTADPCSPNTAWVVLAPGWDPTSASLPTSFTVLQSSSGFRLPLGETLTIPVSDAAFSGDCAAGDPLSQAQADFITQLVFPYVFAGLHYDAATCTVTPAADGGGP